MANSEVFGRGLFKKHFCKPFVKTCSEITINAFFIFPHYKSMATISCDSNQSSYSIGIKNAVIRSPGLKLLYVKFGKNRFMASKEMSFGNVDRQTTTTDNRFPPIL